MEKRTLAFCYFLQALLRLLWLLWMVRSTACMYVGRLVVTEELLGMDRQQKLQHFKALQLLSVDAV